MRQKADWVSDVTYLGIEGWTQTAHGTLIPPLDASGRPLMLRGVDKAEFVEATNKKKCQYCGQWGEPFTACGYCGAPMR